MFRQKSGDILLLNYKRNNIEQMPRIMMVEKVTNNSSICLSDIATNELITISEKDVISYVQVT